VAYEVESVATVAPGVLVAVAGAQLDAPTGPLAGTHRSRFTAVLVDDGDRWAVASFHNTLQLASPAP